ncbi:hypothetical protein DXT99_23050 [Pontibacter diazotrophicus]|uniref:TonB C-terminal domain-containing protein n=1 Tax=Pontibacter diazotrophicus TaxID=1400979 RepID=A0A3D8L3R0_9BACT|nr:carboxypeptidase-like regulatory domain-containing protein [Pontibacter diazotrophicus]RDV12010.1 hypothetical protein DXT99_23050 [Pontibacter diazotrophicus]
MHHDKHHITLDEGGHPPMELLRQYHEDALPPNLSHLVERHLVECDLCADVLEGMALSNAESTKAAVGDLNQRIAAKLKQERKQTAVPAWQMAAAVLLLLCTAFVVIYYNYSKLQQEQNGIAVEQQINSSMDLSLPPAPDSTTEIAGAVESSEPQGIALAPPPSAVERKNVPLIVKRDEEILEEVVVDDVLVEEIMPEMNEEESTRHNREVLKDIDTPSLAAVPSSSGESEISVTESVPFRIADTDAPDTIPESTSVSMALQGKTAGITLRGLNSLNKDAAVAEVVHGQVLSEEGQPLPGVTVQLKGTSTGTTTDVQGNFALPVTGKKPTLLFHYIGYTSAEKAIAKTTAPVNVNLSPDNKTLSEVVVTGYGTTTTGEDPAVAAAKPAIGQRAFRKYVKENLRFPAGPGGERGKVVVGFTVAATGEISEVKVLKSLCPACDAEAIRIIEEGPAWKPATQAGTPVQQQVKVSIPFRQKKR